MVTTRVSLIVALTQYIGAHKLNPEGLKFLDRFVKWYGKNHIVSRLSPSDIEDYSKSAELDGDDARDRVKYIRAFLRYLKTMSLTDVSLSTHIKARKTVKKPSNASSGESSGRAQLSKDGYDNLQIRLNSLLEERINVIGDIKRAMADKDYRENAPLDAAKERQGLIESNIRELEHILTNATIVHSSDTGKIRKARIGSNVTLVDLTNGKKKRYTLVDQMEADPESGKISSVSPVGKALISVGVGDEVHINVPNGILHYKVKSISN